MARPRRPTPPALEWANERLASWAHWARSGRVYPQGYPERAVEARLMDESGISGGGSRAVIPHPEAEAVERAIRSMPDELAVVLTSRYLHRGRDEERFKRAGVDRLEFFVRLRCAKYWLHGRLA